MPIPPLLFDPEEHYCFVDVPAVGYAVNISPLLFGFTGQQTKPKVALFLRDETKKNELEHIIKTEADKSLSHAILNGIGDNSRFYPPSAALLLGFCSAPFACPIHLSLVAFVGVPFFAMPRFLQKRSVEKMTNWFSDAPLYDIKIQPHLDYIAKEGVEKKINNYTEMKQEMSLKERLIGIFKEPLEQKKLRIELANDFKNLYNINLRLLFEVTSAYRFPLIVSREVYRFVHNAYSRKWFPDQKQVIFSNPTCHNHC